MKRGHDDIRTVPPQALAAWHESAKRDEQRRRQYGEVRPIIHETWKGFRFVAVGGRLFYDKEEKWKTFIDFLIGAYLWHVLGADWGKAEMAKPRSERHPILLWKGGHWKYTQTLTPGPDGVYGMVPDGTTRAYVMLAYDLYIIADNTELRRRIVNRLKIHDQFQGARYELFVTATFIRAGFEIEFERETDGAQRHNEFIATHRPSGQRFAVEAKSRHRRGVLGCRQGHPEDRSNMKVGVRQLLEDALAKPAPHPRIVFIDINLPPELLSGQDGQRSFEEMAKTLEDQVLDEHGTSPWNMVVFTNHPYHYVDDGERYPREMAWRLLPERPLVSVDHPTALEAIDEGIGKFGEVPSHFQPKVDVGGARASA
jgi:hypothetical protein